MHATSTFFNKLSSRNRSVLVVVVLVLIGGYFIVTRHKAVEETASNQTREVAVARIADLVNNTTPLPVVGEVKSVNEAKINSEGAGSITALYHKLGDHVAAGTIIAEIENAGQRAAVLQAKGALESAQAQASKTTNGTRAEQLDISQTNTQKAKMTLDQTRASIVDTIKGIYSTNDDLIRSKLDVVFSNPRTNLPHFNFNTSDGGIVIKVNDERVLIEQLLNTETARADKLTANSDIAAEIAQALSDTRTIKQFIDDVSTALNKSISSVDTPQATINGYIAIASAARSTAILSLANLSAATQDLTAKIAAAQTSQTQLSQDTSGSRVEDIASAEAGVKQAQGAYGAALANLEKTIIRSPIGGTLNNLTINLGDFVGAFQQVAIVSNNGALEIVAYITSDDLGSVAVGSDVLIEGRYKGVVTKIAPAVDPVTKKIELRIGLTDSTSALTNGSSVHVDITRQAKQDKKGDGKNAAAAAIAVPISAIKIESDRTVVFTLDAENHLVAHPVTVGPLLSDKIEITSGATSDLAIVTDARGLKEGQVVELKK